MEDKDFDDDYFRGVRFRLPANRILGVRDQSPTDACYAFVLVDMIYADLLINHGKVLKGSEQLLLDCLNDKFPSNSVERFEGAGFPNSFTNAFQYAKGPGILPEDVYPWVGLRKDCRRGKGKGGKIKEDVRIHILDYLRIDNADDAVRYLTDESRPVAASLYVTKKLRKWKMNDGIYSLTNEDKDLIAKDRQLLQLQRHAITLVGYGEENNIQYFLAKNSMGPIFGHNGFFKVERGCISSFFRVVGSCVKDVRA